MARISSQELLARLEKGKPVPAILLVGEEVYLRDTCREQLIARFVSEAARTWAVSRYSAERGQTQAALDQAQTMAMLSPQQVVFLEDAEAIEKLGEKNRDEAVAQLGAYLENPAPFTVLVMEATGLDQRMKLGKLLAEKALVVECGLGENAGARQAAAVALARAIAREEGVEFEKGAAEDLAEFVAADLMRLKTEIDKLATFVAEKKIDRTRGRERPGDFGEDHDGVGISGLAGVEPVEEGAGISRPPAARRGRAGNDRRRNCLDVPQAD